MKQYLALVHKDPESDYGVSFPDVPGCFTAGTTLEDAMAMGAKALRFHLDELLDSGQAVPEARPFDSIIASYEPPEDLENATFALIAPAPRLGKTVRINLSIDEFALKRIDAKARQAGMNRSQFLKEAALSVSL